MFEDVLKETVVAKPAAERSSALSEKKCTSILHTTTQQQQDTVPERF